MSETHIKIADVVPVVRYTANGEQTIFEYGFGVFASEDVAVYVNEARQQMGYSVDGAGESLGGSVTFDTPPAAGALVTIERRLPLERMTDFIEGGRLSARTLNNELDYLAASIQQIARDQGDMLRYDRLEAPAGVTLPARAVRAGRALGFDDNGELTTVSYGDTLAEPYFSQSGAGASLRAVSDKAKEMPSVRDYGAVGDGLSDDTGAFQKALAAHASVFVPAGIYYVSDALVLGEGQSLMGAGMGSVIQGASKSFDLVEMRASYATLANIKLVGGHYGVKLYGADGPCVNNTLYNVVIADASTGIFLDGYEDSAKPCYWNQFEQILVLRPSSNGVHIAKTGDGDAPNANRFHSVRVYSHGRTIGGAGIEINCAGQVNMFTDCEVNVDGSAFACVHVGAGASHTYFCNLFTESFNTVPNVLLDAGSSATSILNLHAMSDGAAIDDKSGGDYTAMNAGYPNKFTLGKAHIARATLGVLLHDTRYVDEQVPATIDVDQSCTLHLVSAYNGEMNVVLPEPLEANGAVYTIKKTDYTDNMVIVSCVSGTGPDGKDVYLGGQYDYVSVLSNGANWHVISSNRMSGNTRYHDGAGSYDIDMAVDTYLLSAYDGNKDVRLPPADAANANGRLIHLKKTDASTNAVNITVQGGGLIDGDTSISLSARYQAISALSNGAQWYVISRYL